MNKKFSTLMMAGLLGAGPLCGSAWAADPIKINGCELTVVEIGEDASRAGRYVVVADNGDGTVGTGDYILKVTSADGKALTYTTVAVTTEVTEDVLSSISWDLTEETQKDGNGTVSGYLYSLKNVGTGTSLTANASMELIKTVAASTHDASKNQYAKFSVMPGNEFSDRFEQKDGLYVYKPDNTTIYNALFIGNNQVITNNAAATPLLLCKLSEDVVDTDDEIEAMNDIMGGEGFALQFTGDDDYENNILNDQNLKAFFVKKNTIKVGNWYVPAGIYLATDYPEELIGENTIGSKADFDACEFIAVNPDVNYEIHEADRESGIGFEFTTVKGADFNFYTETDDERELSGPGEVYVRNACFTVLVQNPLNASGYQLRLDNIRILEKETDKLHKNKGGVYVGSIEDRGDKFLLTDATGINFTLTNETLYAPTGLLNADDTPAIYTIQFVSGEDKETASEYEQYLAPMYKIGDASKLNNQTWRFASVGLINENDPQYQYVIAGVDKENRTATFYNRQSKAKIVLSFYRDAEDPENVYTVFTPKEGTDYKVDYFYVEEVSKDDDKKLVYDTKVDLHKTKVLLTKLDNETIDKYATFMNREEGAGVVKFRLARTAEADAAFYVGADRDNKDRIKVGAVQAWAEDYADNFELIKSKDSIIITSDYVYLYKDEEDNDKDVARLSTVEDTVAYYTYKVKLFEDDSDYDYYLKATSSNEVELTKVAQDANEATINANATNFVIKENVDGSVSLVVLQPTTGVNDRTFIEKESVFVSVKADDEEDAWQTEFYYDMIAKNVAGLKIFVEEETGAISLEPVAQHVSFEASEGGFVSAKDGEVSDELKFWVEPQSDKVNIPSFYIANAGRYMYYAEDSAKHAILNKDKYEFGSNPVNYKLIFKAGELIDANTLQTTVENKTVYVAEKGNVSKNTVGGLNNFLYQIIKFDASSDEYVIRNVGNNKFIRNINGQLTLTDRRENALMVTVTTEEAPTANDEISTSEVKVIAGNGQITIAGAAGKKVVVSNILGQVVANTVITSDNATIAAPQGIVVVAVEGEEAVKAIVK